MTTKLVEIQQKDINSTSIDMDVVSCPIGGDRYSMDIKFNVSDPDQSMFNPETFRLFKTVDVPETLSEFRELHGLSKSELLSWLNENFKK